MSQDNCTSGAGDILARPRLIALIEEPTLAPITLITAPAGYGKSTLAAQWAKHTSCDIAWMSLDPDYNDPGQFLDQLLSALSLADGNHHAISAADILVMLKARTDVRRLMIVLDDLHHIESDEVYGLLNRFLAARIPNVHWMVLTRTMPNLALARVRADGQIREIGKDKLGFTTTETQELSKTLTANGLTRNEAGRLTEHVGGWTTAIRLALLATRTIPDSIRNERLVGGVTVGWIDTYLTEEVLSVLPEDVQDFILHTCGLPYLTPEFTNAVTGTNSGQRILSFLERQFIVRRQVTESHSSMEYARWIVDSLQRIATRRLSHENRLQASERAADYLLSHDQPDLALEEAIKTNDLSLKTRVVRKLHVPLALEDRTVLIRQLLDNLPASTIRQHPDLAYSYAHAVYHRGDTSTLASLVSGVLPDWKESPDPVVRGYARNCRAFVLHRAGDTAGALRYFNEALEHFPQTQYRERLHALAGVFENASDLGDDAAAERALAEAASCTSFLPHHQVTWWMNIQPQLANHHALRGNLSLASELYEYGLKNVPSTFTQHLPYFHFLTATLRFESNDLDGAEALISPSLTSLTQEPPDNWHADALALGARIAHALGQRDLANTRLEKAHARAAKFGNQSDLMQVETIRASWDIEDGNLVAAHAWENYWYPLNRQWIQTFGQLNAIATLLQLRIAERRFDEAITLCDQALVEGSKKRRRVEMISIMLWGVVARWLDGQHDEAIALLRRAQAERGDESIVRAFETPGHDLTPFFHQIELRNSREASLTSGQKPNFNSVSGSSRYLTAREQEVVSLLTDGLSNSEISERLFITERTVKKHVSNILRKLNVTSRTAIVAHARRRGQNGH